MNDDVQANGQIGPRVQGVDYENAEITGIDVLTGIEYPFDMLVHVSSMEPRFTATEASYIARFCFETQYGVGKTKRPPVFVTESSLETIQKAKAAGITPVIDQYENDR